MGCRNNLAMITEGVSRRLLFPLLLPRHATVSKKTCAPGQNTTLQRYASKTVSTTHIFWNICFQVFAHIYMMENKNERFHHKTELILLKRQLIVSILFMPLRTVTFHGPNDESFRRNPWWASRQTFWKVGWPERTTADIKTSVPWWVLCATSVDHSFTSAISEYLAIVSYSVTIFLLSLQFSAYLPRWTV